MKRIGLSGRIDQMSPSIFGVILALPAILVLGLVIIFPLSYNIILSFSKINPTIGSKLSFIGFKNYLEILYDPSFWNALKNTVIISFVAVFFEMASGMLLALILNMNLKYVGVIRTLLMSPVMIAPVVVALLWRWMLADQYGVINYFATVFGLRQIRWLAQPFTAFISIIWVDIWQTTPFIMMLLLAGLQGLPTEPFEAARVDGASPFQVFRYIILPLLQPVILVALITRTTDVFRIFDTVYLLTGGGPGSSTEVLGTFTYKQTFTFLNFGKGSALSLISLLICGIIGMLYIRLLSSKPDR